MNRSMQSILHEEMNKFWWQEEASIKGKVLLLWPSARQIEMLFNKFSVCIIITKYNEMKRSYYKSKWRRSSRLYIAKLFPIQFIWWWWGWGGGSSSLLLIAFALPKSQATKFTKCMRIIFLMQVCSTFGKKIIKEF